MTDDTTPKLPKLLTSGGIAARHGVTRRSVESSPSLPPPDTIADTGGRKLRLWTVASADRWWRERRPKGYRSDLPGKYTGRVVGAAPSLRAPVTPEQTADAALAAAVRALIHQAVTVGATFAIAWSPPGDKHTGVALTADLVHDGGMVVSQLDLIDRTADDLPSVIDAITALAEQAAERIKAGDW